MFGRKRARYVSFTPSTKETESVDTAPMAAIQRGKRSSVILKQAPGSARLGRHSVDRNAAKGKQMGELLRDTGHFFIREYVELLGVTPTCEPPNSFEVESTAGTLILYVTEVETNCHCCLRCCFGTKRRFTFKVTNLAGEVLFHIKRNCSSVYSSTFCGSCPGNSITVTLSDGVKLGKVKQRCGCCSKCATIFDAFNAHKDKVLTIKGPTCGTLSSYKMEELEVSRNGEKIGTIRRHWSGLLHETLIGTDTFGAEFLDSLDVDVKALLLGAVIFIDFTYFGRGRGIFGKVCGC